MRYARDLIPQLDELPSRLPENFPEIVDSGFWEFYAQASPFSMVHVTGFFNLYQSLTYIAANQIPGDIVECGCFLGGAAIFAGLMRKAFGMYDKRIILYDTFRGPPPGIEDVNLGQREMTGPHFEDYLFAVKENIVQVLGTLDGYVFIQGYVEETLPAQRLTPISLLRLDTDYYYSTKAELVHLYPHLVAGGVLIVDDYGIYEGAREATDEYFSAVSPKPLLNRIDIGVWAGIKP